jgi:hypothetical protein
MWSDAKKVVVLVELTVCFETNYQDAQRRKTTKYLSLADEIGMKGYVADIIPVHLLGRCGSVIVTNIRGTCSPK